ncbi:MAG: type II secretion system F family protein [Tepidisphaeraceae bacterium]|jgi:type II secretory pathway component PulF
MAVFDYNAVDTAQAPNRGILVADTPRQARDLLRARGLTIQRLDAQEGQREGRLTIGRRRHVQRVARFAGELSMLIGAGIPLLEAIDAIARENHGAFSASLAVLRDRITAGSSLADAMAEQPALFDDLTVAIVDVGEQAGSLEIALARLAGFMERSLAFKNRLATALAYPSFVLVMAVSVAVGLMTFVMPKLLEGLTESGQQLPAITVVVKAASDLLVTRWWAILAVIAAGGAALAAILRSPVGRVQWDRVLLKIPIVGEIIRRQTVSRIAVVIATLMSSGVVFLRALRIAQRGTSNSVFRDALGRCETAVAAGRDISSALDDTGVFGPVVVRVFSVGQQSGRLEEMLEKLAADYDRQVALAADRLTALLEPVLVLLLVGLVGMIALATVLPLMEAADVLQ